MAETSGFFQAIWDETILNEDGTYGNYDRKYLAKQFSDFMGLFFKNGVFGNPTNQCRVIPGTGNSIIVTPGWAIINGCWYYNDSNKEIVLVTNGTANNRVDTIRLRFDNGSRTILALAFTGDTNLVRGENVYDLKIADVLVPPYSVTIPQSNITDTRMNESVCGFVTGVLEVQTTEDLFAQYNAIFNAWFDTVKDQVTGDLAIQLQMEFDELNRNVEDYKNTAQGLIEDYVYNDYVIPEKVLTFENKQCIINDNKVTNKSLIDVYFTADTIQEAEDCKIFVDSTNGSIILTAETQPTKTIKALFRVRIIQ